MAGKTISAHLDTETADRISYIAKIENRRTSQIAGMALKFFISLPPEARVALWQIEAFASTDDFEELTRELTRILLHTQYKMAHQRIMEQMKVDNLEQIETEEDILQAGIALTS
jgi:predicted transcriptional regulator